MTLPCRVESSMALVKTTKIAAPTQHTVESPAADRPSSRARGKVAPAQGGDKLSERLAAATEELASGLSQASAAAGELRRAMEQIAGGA